MSVPRVLQWSGSAAAFHGRALPTDGTVHLWWFSVDRPALVLGSSQRDEVVDHVACASAGVEVVRRRSGGGAVLLVPGAVVWLDVVLPGGHRRWDHDVGRATWWLGDAWASALSELGVADPEVHRGGLVSTPWSPLVCFAGLGPGEVTVGGHKLVGISQRRTRDVARFQCALQLTDVTVQLLGLLAPHELDPAELTGIGSLTSVGAVVGGDTVAAVVQGAVLRALGDTSRPRPPPAD